MSEGRLYLDSVTYREYCRCGACERRTRYFEGALCLVGAVAVAGIVWVGLGMLAWWAG